MKRHLSVRNRVLFWSKENFLENIHHAMTIATPSYDPYLKLFFSSFLLKKSIEKGGHHFSARRINSL